MTNKPRNLTQIVILIAIIPKNAAANPGQLCSSQAGRKQAALCCRLLPRKPPQTTHLPAAEGMHQPIFSSWVGMGRAGEESEPSTTHCPSLPSVLILRSIPCKAPKAAPTHPKSRVQPKPILQSPEGGLGCLEARLFLPACICQPEQRCPRGACPSRAHFWVKKKGKKSKPSPKWQQKALPMAGEPGSGWLPAYLPSPSGRAGGSWPGNRMRPRNSPELLLAAKHQERGREVAGTGGRLPRNNAANSWEQLPARASGDGDGAALPSAGCSAGMRLGEGCAGCWTTTTPAPWVRDPKGWKKHHLHPLLSVQPP